MNEEHEVIVVVQDWIEGQSKKPDGFSLHRTDDDRRKFIREYWARMREVWNQMPNLLPEECSRPVGRPYKSRVDPVTYAKVMASEHGIRDFGHHPGAGEINGWVLTR